MPKLRVLSLLQWTYKPFTMQEITPNAIHCFRRLPSLEYIILRDHREDGKAYRYQKLTLAPNLTGGILQAEVTMDYDLGAAWWTVYNV